MTRPKRFFADPSLAVAALGLSAESLLRDWQTFGLVFESLCLRDLAVYARALEMSSNEPLRYYRDDSGLEADAIIELVDGRWAAFEVKVSDERVPEGVAALKRLRKKVVSDNPATRVRPSSWQSSRGPRAMPARSRMASMPFPSVRWGPDAASDPQAIGSWEKNRVIETLWG